jgi:cytochrome c oxidase subunit 3/cytochrome o ubiquinol oxidase subunit 3
MNTAETSWRLPSRNKLGMMCFILAESGIFASFVAAYIFYLGKSLTGPTPREVLKVPMVTTVCLLSSSLTMHRAIAELRQGRIGVFRAFWFATFLLGATFIGGTAMDWRRLIYQENFTIGTNLFGMTYYSLVGLHASHVMAGLMGLGLVLILTLMGKMTREHSERCEVFSLYWHFVDAVWIAIFATVYIMGR